MRLFPRSTGGAKWRFFRGGLAVCAIAAPQGAHKRVRCLLRRRRELLRALRFGAQMVGGCERSDDCQSFRHVRAAIARPHHSALPVRTRPQIWLSPPSTLISTPVTYDASAEARNATTPATSSGSPNRFIGTFSLISFAKSSRASWDRPVRPNIGVTIGPGATALTRILRSTSSAAAVRANDRRAAFVAE